MRKSTKSITGNDAMDNTGSSSDAIRRVNAKKGLKVGNSDAALPPEQTPIKRNSKSITGNDSTNSVKTPDDNGIVVSPEMIQDMKSKWTKAQAEQDAAELNRLQAELEATQQRYQEQQDLLDKQRRDYEDMIAKKNKEIENWTRALSVSDDIIGGGVTVSPAVLTGGKLPTPSRSYITDAYREMERILTDTRITPKFVSVNPFTGDRFEQKDNRAIDKFVKAHKDECFEALEMKMKKDGLLRGNRAVSSDNADAFTTQGNVAPGYLEILSSFVRLTHTPKHIHWQFSNKAVAIGYNQGETVKVYRANYAESGTNIGNWQLDPGQMLTLDSQPVELNAVDVKLQEYGMGKDKTMRPIAIPNFLVSTSVIELMNVLNTRLGYNYNQFQDLAIRSLWEATSRVVYNANSSVTTNPANVVAGAGGGITVSFLNNLYAYMSSLQIPAYENGFYGLRLHPTALSQLKNDILAQKYFFDRDDIEEITNLFQASTSSEMDKITGYEGSICNFMIFSSNASSVGAVGTEGVQSTTLGAGTVTTRSSYAFGRDTVVQASAMPFSIRRDNNDNFGRVERYTWVSIEAFAALDVDPASNPPLSDSQQLRVIEIRSVDALV